MRAEQLLRAVLTLVQCLLLATSSVAGSIDMIIPVAVSSLRITLFALSKQHVSSSSSALHCIAPTGHHRCCNVECIL
jgi:hypothetical protein